MQTRFAPSFVVVCLLLAIGIVVALVLWAAIGPDDADPPPSTVAAATTATTPTTVAAVQAGGSAVQVAALASYDPPAGGGNGEERDDQLPAARADGDPATNWTTECYSGQYMGKAGVGIVLTLSAPSSGTVSFDVGSAPHVVDVFATAAEQVPTEIGVWGVYLQRFEGTAPAHRQVEIPSAARHILVLIQQAGQAPGCSAEHPYQGMLGELAFSPAP